MTEILRDYSQSFQTNASFQFICATFMNIFQSYSRLCNI